MAGPILPPLPITYDQRTIRAWDGLYGVTAGYVHPATREMMVASQDKYWIWSTQSQRWIRSGFLGDWWGDAPPPLDLNPPSSEAPRQRRRRLVEQPWNYPGVTAACFSTTSNLYAVVSTIGTGL